MGTAVLNGLCTPLSWGAFVFWPVSGHFGELHAVYQAVHSADADVNAIITLENELHLIGTKAFIIISVDNEG